MNRLHLRAHHAVKFYSRKARHAVRHDLPEEQERFRILTDRRFDKAALTLEGNIDFNDKVIWCVFVSIWTKEAVWRGLIELLV